MPSDIRTHKVVILGDSNVGKTSLVGRFLYHKFDPTSQTIGLEFATKVLKVANKGVMLHIWDCAGAQCFRSIIQGYYKQASGALVCFDVCDRKSFDSLPEFIKTFREHSDPDSVVIVVANKVDLKDHREIHGPEIARFAKSHNVDYVFETSAKTGSDVDQCFLALARSIVQQAPKTVGQPTIKLEERASGTCGRCQLL